jgi:hypothetical protein
MDVVLLPTVAPCYQLQGSHISSTILPCIEIELISGLMVSSSNLIVLLTCSAMLALVLTVIRSICIVTCVDLLP